jgi:threonine dehydratase
MIKLEDVHAARQRVLPYIRRTPLEKSQTLSRMLGTNVYLKYELFQKTGSFKPRGAFNQMLALDPSGRKKGVVAVSGGNFAQGVAYAGQVLGVSTLICMPAYTPQNYIEATKAYGAEVEIAPTIADVFEQAEEHHRRGKSFLHPYDDPAMMAGNGSAGLEILEDLPQATDVFISVGGGGLLGGMMTALKGVKPEIRIWSVETEGAEALGEALRAGKVVQVQITSLAKTLGGPYVAADTLQLAQQHLQEHIIVSDKGAFFAQRTLLERCKVLTELAASCTLAAAEKVRGSFQPDDHVVLLLCGGNVSLDNLIEYRQLLGVNAGKG